MDYTFLLEAAVKGHVLSFTDDKAKRHEMNKGLATLAGSVANLFRKTKGRAKQELVNKVKKFHGFEDQVKSWQSVETLVKKLETELEEWKKKYKNVEKEKEDLFNQMTQIIHEKDRVISHLQKTNSELEDYVANLEKINGVQAEYKGKPLSVSQNKTRTLKIFLTRAEVALWFSKSFGLNIETILIRESDTGVKHTLDMRSQLPVPSDLTEPQEQGNNTKYRNLSEEEQNQIEEILYLLDKFCVGDSFYHELTMVTEGLPRSYLIQQCRTELNKVCHIDCLPGRQPGAKVHAIKDVIQDCVEEYLKQNPNTDKIQIKINGDGARMTRNSSFVLLSFSILQTGKQVMTAKGNRTIAILNGKEDYISLKNAFGNIFEEINNMIAEAKFTVNGKEHKTEFFLGGDYKYILIMLGLNGATGNYACAWCKIHKNDRWKMENGSPFQ